MPYRRWTAALLLLALCACRKWKEPPPAPPPAPPAAQQPAAPEPAAAAAAAPAQEPAVEIRNPAIEPFPCGHLTILARDPETGDLGLGLLTGCPGGPGFMTAGRAGVGIAVCGNYPDTTWAARAVDGLAAGRAGEAVLAELQQGSTSTTAVQLGLMAADGRSWVFTGTNTLAKWADRQQPDLCVLGTNMVGTVIPEITEEAYQKAAGLPLAERLLLALRAAADCLPRGRKGGTGALHDLNRPVAAALLVLRKDSGHDGRSDRLVDVRLDWHPDPMPGLEEAYRNQLAAVIWPRLKIQQRALTDRDDPLYQSNARWLERLRLRKGVGER